MLAPYRILTPEQARHNTSFRYSDHMIRRVVAAAALAVVLMAALPAVARADLETRNGDGTLRASATGIAYGAVGKGSIWLLDRTADGKRGWSVSGSVHRRIHHSGNWWEIRGSNMSFFTQKAWSLRIYASGIRVRIVANGTLYLQGTGRYAFGSTWHNWPVTGRSYLL